MATRILALDGHDGCGKTTLARSLAQAVGAIYVRPFGGEAGVQLLKYAEEKQYDQVSRYGHQMIQNQINLYPDAVLVFDRHWMTVFSLLPETYWGAPRWQPLPPTTLCLADLLTTLQRLGVRDEEKYSEEYHSYYLALYEKLANTFQANILRTDRFDIEHCLKSLTQWWKSIQV